MANLIYGFTALTGGTADALDYIDGDVLVDKDVAIGCVSGVFYVYTFDADSAAAEASPGIIGPDAPYAGDGRWVQAGVYNSLPSGAYSLSDGETIAINWTNGASQYVTLGGNRTITFANPVSGQVYRIILTQDGMGSRTITWPTVKWSGGAAPTLSTPAASIDIVTLLYVGTTYYADCSLAFATP